MRLTLKIKLLKDELNSYASGIFPTEHQLDKLKQLLK